MLCVVLCFVELNLRKQAPRCLDDVTNSWLNVCIGLFLVGGAVYTFRMDFSLTPLIPVEKLARVTSKPTRIK